MKHIITILFFLCAFTMNAQTHVVTGPTKQQTTATKPKPQTSTSKPKPTTTSKPKISQPEIVDLGLSVYWANCNVGASVAHECGYYFQWGDTKIVNDKYADRKTYKYGGQIPTKEISGTKYDAATYYLGNGWRIPTYVETSELMEKCVFEPTTVYGIQCAKVTGPNGNSIILPFTGIRQDDSFTNSHGADYTTSSAPDNIRRTEKDRETPSWESGSHYNSPVWLNIYFGSSKSELNVCMDPWDYGAYYGHVIRPVKSK